MEMQQTPAFAEWFDDLRDRKAKSKIAARIARIELGLMGDIKPVGDGVSEARIDFGPGYRLYFTRRGNRLIILLVGGDKSTQQRRRKWPLRYPEQPNYGKAKEGTA